MCPLPAPAAQARVRPAAGRAPAPAHGGVKPGSAPHEPPNQFRCMGQEMGKQVKQQEMGLLGTLPWR